MSPQLIILFSGKRKSGKDFVADRLLQHIGDDKCEIIRISEPVKEHWAIINKLNLQQLLSDGPYKERYRQEMIHWSDKMRSQTPIIFCRQAYMKATKPIVIVSDIRRRTDIEYFRTVPDVRLVTVRILADDSVRVRRGWTFQQGIDDVPSECDLDEVLDWDVVVHNDGVNLIVEEKLADVLKVIEEQFGVV